MEREYMVLTDLTDNIFINPCAEKYYIFSVIYECANITFF